MSHVLGLDQGTTSSRAIVFGPDGRPAGAGQREVKPSLPRPGWVEQDPRELWSTLAASAEAALREAGLGARDVSALGLTNQRETVVLWDRATGDPVCDAIVWQDRRTAEACAKLKADGAEALVRRKTGLLLDPYFSATKLAWMLDRHKGLRTRAEAGELAFGTVDSWVLFNLTGGKVHATDPSNASRTLLFDIHQLRWDDELLELFGIPRALLPEVRPTMGDFGVCARPGALKGLPIRAIVGDQQSALYGQGCHEPGAAKNTYGTGCFLLMHTGAEAATSERLLSSVAWTGGDDPPAYCIEGSVFTAGAAIDWLRDGLGVIRDAAEINRLAASATDSDGVVFVPALAGLGAPHWDPDARGSITGLTRGTTAAHLARATLEGIAHQVADLVGEMESATGARIESLRVDGGAAASDLLMQIQADILRRPVVRPAMLETTAFGAASAASGLRMPEAGADVFEPRTTDAEARAQEGRWRAAVAACLTASGGR